MPKRVSCPNCGAPLPAPREQEWLHCEHCGGDFERTRLVRVGGGNGPLIVGVLAAFMMVLGAASVGLFVLTRQSASDAPPSPPALPALPALPKLPELPTASLGGGGVPLSRLPEMGDHFGWFVVDAPGMKGSWTDFRMLDNMEWMLGIGQHWAADLRLTRLGLDGVLPNGTLDVSSREDFSVDARYASPALRQVAVTSAQVSEAKVKTEFRLDLSESKVNAMISEAFSTQVNEPVPPPPTLGCDLPELMQAFRDNGLTARPSYSLLLQWIDGGGRRDGYWRWTIDSMKAGDRIESSILDPATCRKR